VHATGPPLQHAIGGQKGANHPNFSTGKYGSLVLYKTTPDAAQLSEAKDSNGPSVAELGRQLCQHVVGMNPQSIGAYDPESGVNGEAPSEDETRLVYQEYMLDTTQTVGAVLLQQGLGVVDYVRLECGAEEPAQRNERSADEQSAVKSVENAATN